MAITVFLIIDDENMQIKNSFDCNQYLDAFQNVLNPDIFSDIYDSQIEIELASINAIICVGEILTSKHTLKNNLKFKIFSKPNANYIDFMVILKNIIDLPVIYPKSIRCCAIKQIGTIVRRINNTKDSQFTKIAYEYAQDFSQRLLSTAKMAKEFVISYLYTIGKMSIDQYLQQILFNIIEKYIRLMNTLDLDIQIAVCKTVQYLKQPSSEILNFFKKLSQSQDAPLSLSSYGSLSFITLSLQIGNQLNLSKLLAHILEIKSLESTSETVVSPSLKIINQIALHSINDKKRCIEILKEFAFGKSKVCRHQALKLAGNLARKFDDSNTTKKILKACATHISNFVDGKTPLIKSIVNTTAVIGIYDSTNANQIYQLFKSILDETYDIPKKIFDYMTHFTQSVLRTKTHIINYSKEDIFQNYIIQESISSEDSELVIKLHKNLVNNKIHNQLLKPNFFFDPKLEYGYINIQNWEITIPEEITIYEDILSLFVACCIDVFKFSSTIKAFKDAIDSQKVDLVLEKVGMKNSDERRVAYEDWNQIVSALGPLAISNYAQLFFALINDPELCTNPILVDIFAELQFTKEHIEKRKRNKEKIRKPSNVDRRSILQWRTHH